ncbi:MAG: FGGY family carbohydrate kinase, partial [Cyclobacteriaceae bacterium]|nr:FGGY family carbohydrate kinase [Cyclobacteriaceae bacterium]
MKKYVIGVDFGTDSVRSVLVDTEDGKEIASEVHYYKRWAEKKYCNSAKNQFRQHPQDHVEGLELTIKKIVKEAGVDSTQIKSICVDTTGSSPLPVDQNGTPLAMLDGLEGNPNAMMVLWKDHTAINEANEINELSVSWGGVDFTKYEGGIYSSEWFWAKILHVIREDKEIRQRAYSWMEHCDWMTYMLIENQDLSSFKRSRCAAGHKAMWHEEWNGLPPVKFLEKLDPYLATLRGQLYNETFTSDTVAGNLSVE